MPRIFPDRIPSGRRFRASTEGKDRTKARVRPPTAPASEEHPNGRSALRRLAVWMRIVNFVRTNDRTMTSYLQAEGLTKSFGERVLFENLSLAVGEGQRIGLIAKNGTGKTTLLNILAGKEDYEAGRITRRRDLKIAYLEQDPKLPAGKTVLDACLTGDSPALLRDRGLRTGARLGRRGESAPGHGRNGRPAGMELRIAGQADSHPAAYHRLRPADRAAVGRTSQARGACQAR